MTKVSNPLNSVEINYIFSNENFTDNDKYERIQRIFSRIEQFRTSQIWSSFYEQVGRSIKKNLDRLTTQPQQALLRLLQIIVQIGLHNTIDLKNCNEINNFQRIDEKEILGRYPQIYYDKNRIIIRRLEKQDQFIKDLIFSGLSEKIDFLWTEKAKIVEEKEEEMPFSGLDVQLAHLFMLFNKDQIIRENIMDKFILIVDKNLTKLIKLIKELSVSQFSGEIYDEQFKDKVQISVMNGAWFLDSIADQYKQNSYSFISNLLLHEKYVELMHINCSLELDCPHRIALKPNYALMCLHNSILRLLEQSFGKSDYWKKLLVDKHDIFAHTAYFFIDSVNRLISLRKQQLIQNLEFHLNEVPYLSTVYQSIVLNKCFVDKEKGSIKLAAQIPQFIKALSQMLFYRAQNFSDADALMLAIEIQEQSRQYLNEFLKIGLIDNFDELDYQFAVTAVSLRNIAVCGGIVSQNDNNIRHSIDFITNIYRNTQKTSSFNQVASANVKLIKIVDEQAELEGQVEEIEGNLFRKNEPNSDYDEYLQEFAGFNDYNQQRLISRNIKDSALQFKRIITNVLKRQQQWDWY